MAANFVYGNSALVNADGKPTRIGLLFFSGLVQVSGDVDVTVVNGIATPDLSQGRRFLLVLTADTTLNLPDNAPSSDTVAAIPWTLIVQQDAVGGHSLLTPAYHMAYALSTVNSPASTESVQNFSTDSSTTRVVGAPSVDQPIP